MRILIRVLPVIIFFIPSMGLAQNNGDKNIDEYISLIDQGNIKEYFEPFATGFGMGSNSEWFTTAATRKTFGFEISIKGMVAFVPDENTTFLASFEEREIEVNGFPITIPAGQQTWSTIVGPPRPSGADPTDLNPGGVDFNLVPVAFPQLTLGLPGDFDVTLRFLPSIDIGDQGSVSLFGLGLRHNLRTYFSKMPGFPDITVGGAFQKFDVGNIVEANNWNVQAVIGKRFPIFSLYAGAGIEQTTIDLNYTIDDPGSSIDGQSISAALDGDNNFRFMVGGRIKLFLLSINGTLNLGKYTTISGGIGLGLR